MLKQLVLSVLLAASFAGCADTRPASNHDDSDLLMPALYEDRILHVDTTYGIGSLDVGDVVVYRNRFSTDSHRIFYGKVIQINQSYDAIRVRHLYCDDTNQWITNLDYIGKVK